jgi:aryl-alcohol dehydrogenase-like predicted oxidoreductase
MQYRALGKTEIKVSPYCLGAILGPRTMQQLDDLLAGADISLSDEILDQIDEVVAPGADSGRWAVYTPPAVTQASLRRCPAAERRAS